MKPSYYEKYAEVRIGAKPVGKTAINGRMGYSDVNHRYSPSGFVILSLLFVHIAIALSHMSWTSRLGSSIHNGSVEVVNQHDF